MIFQGNEENSKWRASCDDRELREGQTVIEALPVDATHSSIP